MVKSKKAPAAKPAKKVVALKAANPATLKAGDIQLIAAGKLHESKLNPRKQFDADKLKELADSIARDGVLENLIARPHPKKRGEFELASGARRLRAIVLLIKEKRVPADYLVPVKVKEFTNRELIATAVIENVQRSDMHPMEAGECFAAWRDAGDTTEAIAERLGKSQKWVQYHISFVERLAAPAQKAFRKGEINTRQALALIKGEPKTQATILGSVKGGHLSSPTAIVRALTGEAPPEKSALFDRALYKGEMIEAEDGVGGPWFADRAQFIELQQAEIKAKEKALKETWAWVETRYQSNSQWFSSWDWNKSQDKSKAGAIIEVKRDWSVEVHTGLVKKKDASSAGGAKKKAVAKSKAKAEDPIDAPPQITQPLMLHAKHQKTIALQEAIAFSPDPLRDQGIDIAGGQLKAAIILVCIALMGEDEVTRIRFSELRSEDAALSPLLSDALEGFRGGPLGEVLVDPKQMAAGELRIKPGSAAKPGAAAEAFRLLWKMPPDNVRALFAVLVATRCGTFNPPMGPVLGDSDLAIEVARSLGVDMSKSWGGDLKRWEAYLALCKKSRLVRLVGHSGGKLGLSVEQAVKLKAPDLVAKIMAGLQADPELQRLLPVELKFFTGKEMDELLNEPAERSEPRLDLKPAAKPKKAVKAGKGKSAGKAKVKAAKPASSAKRAAPARNK